MKFHEHPIVPTGTLNKGARTTIYGNTVTKDIMEFGDQSVDWLQEAWKVSARPFYNIYPAVTRCLENTSLSFAISSLTTFFPPTAICLAEGHEITLASKIKASSIVAIVLPYHNTERGQVDEPVVMMAAHTTTPDGGHGVVFTEYHGSERLCDIAEEAGELPVMLKICAGVMMLASDPDFAERILLNRDRKRIDRLDTPEKMQLAVDRAIRNGRNGWTIGEHLEVSPHTRRPHFAIRWTGKGSTTPRLRPIKGCVVKRSRLYPIPTGHMDKK